MFSKKSLRVISATAVAAGLALATAIPVQAADVTYNFVRKSTLTNVDDAEGRWQFDGGDVYIGKTKVGNYTRKKRVSFGIPSSVNRSSMEMTVIWSWGDHNFTLQGTHYFHDGTEVGGVSATSAGFSAYDGASFTGNHNSLTITY